MKMRRLILPITLLLFFVSSAYATDSVSENAKTPSAMIGEKDFRFDPVVDGSTVTHDYLVKNMGESTLEISQVKTG
jgi:hypothetical protein